ncbi:MAG: hypothetical protein K0R38_1988 [Polyangiaceae bacterium]|nr:hypothetical protein [Polyangiaceae bacterium]
MDCAEIRNGFVAGRLPAGPEVEAHLQSCPHCSELFAKGAQLGRQLGQSALPEPQPGDLFTLVNRDLQRESGLRATLRALPTGARAGGLLSVALALLAYELGFNRREDFAQFSPLVFWAVVALLIGAVALGAVRLLRGANAPLGAAARDRGVAGALLILPAIAALVVPIGSEMPGATEAYGNPMGCFLYGSALIVPFVLLYWLFERRDSVPVTSLVSAGALAGIAANLLLHAHCFSAHLGHLLLGHASIGAVWALGLGLLSRPLQAR